MRNVHASLIAIVSVLLAWAGSMRDGLADDRRVAPVVGNSLYRSANLVLPNPKNDAQDIAAALRDLDFEVIELTDAKKPDFDQTLANFARLASGADVGGVLLCRPRASVSRTQLPDADRRRGRGRGEFALPDGIDRRRS
jgi:hypothetical protein